jgi:hypothetical protein
MSIGYFSHSSSSTQALSGLIGLSLQADPGKNPFVFTLPRVPV